MDRLTTKINRYGATWFGASWFGASWYGATRYGATWCLILALPALTAAAERIGVRNESKRETRSVAVGPREAFANMKIDKVMNVVVSPRGGLVDSWEEFNSLGDRESFESNTLIDAITPVGEPGAVAGGGCTGNEEVSLTDANFEGGEYLLQQGFAEGEFFAATYDIPINHFPLTFRQLDFIIAQSSIEATETHYTVFIWYGDPGGAANSVEIARFNSMEDLAPVQMDPGVAGTNVRVLVDAGDSDQIIIENPLNLDRISIGVRIDQHNNPWPEPCLPENIHLQTNAFPVVDTSGVLSVTNNWLFGVDCIVQICPLGWSRFSDLGICRPSGDWVMKMGYECAVELTFGACCQPDGECLDNIVNTVCAQFGADATFYEGQSCNQVICPEPVGACCAFDTCLTSQTATECQNFGGVYLGPGSNCDDSPCSPGACCKPDGTCEEVTESDCLLDGGVFQGVGEVCANVDCPQPKGACCFGDVCVDGQLQANCEVSGTWQGAFSTCQTVTCVDCSSATIVASSPVDGAVDARQPYEPGMPQERYGFGADGNPIVIQPSDFVDPACFSICETLEDPILGPNEIVSVSGIFSGVPDVAITLSHPITPGGVTTITYEGDGSYIELIAHPANVEASGFAGGNTVAALIDYLEGDAVAPYGLISTDIDRNGAAEPEDLLRLIDLLNGAEDFQAWHNTTLPENTNCPE
ncbi:MAG: hypothetical protein ACPGXK_14175 [Phycisphaerae bacterium]